MTPQEQEQLKQAEEEILQLKEQLREKDIFLRRTLGQYLTDEVAAEILQHQDSPEIRGERRKVTMMFTDLRRSTELAERMEPTDFIRMLNHYYGEMIEIINAWQGNILEFVGDAIVAVFGAPRPNEEAAQDAVSSAVAMQRRMPAINRWNLQQGFPEIEMGIGIHTGEAILGNIGSQTRTKYDLIGRNVNLASRIEGYTRGGQILVSDETMEAAAEVAVEDPEGAVRVTPKGIKGEILLHDVIGAGELRIERTPGRDLTERNGKKENEKKE